MSVFAQVGSVVLKITVCIYLIFYVLLIIKDVCTLSCHSSNLSFYIPFRFQVCLYFAAIFQAISCGIHYLASVFLVETPKFLCDTPNITDILYRNHSSSSLADIWTHYKPGDGPVVVRTARGDQWELSPCLKALRLDTIDFQYEFFGNKTVESCGGFVYDHSEVVQSIVTDWDLVCEKEWLAKLSQPTFMLGVLVGALVFGDVADR